MASRPTRQRISLRELGQAIRRCSSQKIGHDTYDQALTAAERLMELGKVSPGCHITPYFCSECHQWHNANRIIIVVPKDQR